MRPGPKLAAETGADKFRDHSHILFRQAKHLRESASKIEYSLRLFVNRQVRAFPNCGGGLQLDRIMRLGWRDIRLVELDWCAGKSAFRIAALAFHPLGRLKRSINYIRLIIRFEIGFDVWLFLNVSGANGVSRSFSALKRVRDSERDVLAVVPNDVVFEWRSPLIVDAFESLAFGRTKNLVDLAVRDRRFDRDGIEQPGEMKV